MVILQGASTARYINTGHLLFSRSGVLYIVPFDAGKLEVTGQPVPVIEGVYSETTTGITNYVCADNGDASNAPGCAAPASPQALRQIIDTATAKGLLTATYSR